MSAWTQLYSLGSSIIKRPVVWLGGVIGTVATGYVTGYITEAVKPVERYLSETACRYRQKPIPNESQLTILVSPLAHDPDRLYTEKVQRAFLGEEGFLTVPICESLNFDFSTNSQSAWDDMQQRATELINAKHADLLLFGDVSEPGKAVLIYAVNEHGGCDRQPKPTEIRQGVLGSDFTAEEKKKLIEVSLEQIQSACLNESSIVWSDFAKRMSKMEIFLDHFDFSLPKSLYFAGSYIDAVRLLYEHGQGELWFSKGEEFAKGIIHIYQNQGKGADKELSIIYAPYASLLVARFDKTKDQNDLDAALSIFGKAITLNPNDSVTYVSRGLAFRKKGELDRAIEDSTKAIGLDPKYAGAWNERCWERAIAGHLQQALSDCNQALDLQPDNTHAHDSRAFVYLKMGKLESAIADYDIALLLDPRHATSLYGRGVAKLKKDDITGSNSDIESARRIQPDIVDEFKRYAIQ